MSITTKTGDSGKTSLYFGPRVPKDDLRIETYGTLDELCSFLGLAKSFVKDRETKDVLEAVQRDLFIIGAEIATLPNFFAKLKERINNNHIGKLETLISALESKKKFRDGCFYLPGENFLSSSFDIARVITRRAERRAVTLKKKRIIRNGKIIIYLNRLSDLLYLFARSCEQKSKKLK
jgi:ATP:cob(I)alamin adenosyltransferase